MRRGKLTAKALCFSIPTDPGITDITQAVRFIERGNKSNDRTVRDRHINYDSHFLKAGGAWSVSLDKTDELLKSFTSYIKQGGYNKTRVESHEQVLNRLERFELTYALQDLLVIPASNQWWSSSKTESSVIGFIPVTQNDLWLRHANELDTFAPAVKNRDKLFIKFLKKPLPTQEDKNRFFDSRTREPIVNGQVDKFMAIIRTLEVVSRITPEQIRDKDFLFQTHPNSITVLQHLAETMLYGSYIEAYNRIRFTIPRSVLDFTHWAEIFVNTDTIWELQPTYCEWYT